MRDRPLIWVGFFIGSFVGGYIPALWGGGLLSMSSVLLSAVGASIGAWIGYRLT
ncbi:MAG: hypothetical protein NUV64_03125 [Parcubacteria group bacterium]|nr:hypothetical protein [Parcubacteria group bacterium]MCR4342400.1 hypothetical protein [Patescibacteria group bacterium]